MTRTAIVATVIVTSLAAGRTALAPPPAIFETLPGASQGQIRSRWLAPWVLVTNRTVGTNRTTIVQWLGEDGTVVREMSGPIAVHRGFISENPPPPGQTVVHAVNDDWTLVVPKKPGRPGFIHCSDDSQTFIHQFRPQRGRIAVDVYVLGTLVRTIGPFPSYKGNSIRIFPDGGMALLVSREDDHQMAQVVVADRYGRVRFRRDCAGPVTSPSASPDGTAVVVRPNVGGPGEHAFFFFDEKGRESFFNMGASADFVRWVPGTTTGIIMTRVVEGTRYHLVDCSSGRKIWTIPDPVPHPRVYASVVVAGDYVLFSAYDFAAVDLATGDLVARWQPEHRSQLRSSARICRIDGRLFIMTAEEFSEFDVDDITARRNGWK